MRPCRRAPSGTSPLGSAGWSERVLLACSRSAARSSRFSSSSIRVQADQLPLVGLHVRAFAFSEPSGQDLPPEFGRATRDDLEHRRTGPAAVELPHLVLGAPVV